MRSRRCGRSMSGRSGQSYKLRAASGTWRCSIWPSTASSVADLVSIRVEDIAPRGYAVDRASVRQKKTRHPVKFELTEATANRSTTT